MNAIAALNEPIDRVMIPGSRMDEIASPPARIQICRTAMDQ
jgi:hypothetical protein